MYIGNELCQLLRFKIFLLLFFRGLLLNTLLGLQNPKKIGTRSAKTLVIIYQSEMCNIAEDLNLPSATDLTTGVSFSA
jgi:hypothetical protein